MSGMENRMLQNCTTTAYLVNFVRQVYGCETSFTRRLTAVDLGKRNLNDPDA